MPRSRKRLDLADNSAKRKSFEIALASDGVLRCTRVGCVRFEIAGKPASLAVYWFEGYGGGLWLPFSDASTGTETYGGGRYLYDTIKGADLGIAGSEILLDTRVGPAVMVASIEPSARVHTHDKLRLALNPARLHLFDAESEEAI